MHKGVVRIIEALASGIIIIAAFTLAYYFIIPPAVSHQRSQEDLIRFGYNLLLALSKNNGFDELIFDENQNIKTNWEQQLKVAINTLVPNNVIFDINVYRPKSSQVGEYNVFDLEKLNNSPISNAENEFFLKSGEVAQISYIYTTKHMEILIVELKLSYLGGM
ncbi:MAG: hypothetical protein QW738_01410 [Nitrososphaeria archaeon]